MALLTRYIHIHTTRLHTAIRQRLSAAVRAGKALNITTPGATAPKRAEAAASAIRAYMHIINNNNRKSHHQIIRQDHMNTIYLTSCLSFVDNNDIAVAPVVAKAFCRQDIRMYPLYQNEDF